MEGVPVAGFYNVSADNAAEHLPQYIRVSQSNSVSAKYNLTAQELGI